MTAGGRSARVAACAREELPERYRSFTDTSFIGPAHKIDVGPVSYNYHRFGPLEPGKSSGELHNG